MTRRLQSLSLALIAGVVLAGAAGEVALYFATGRARNGMPVIGNMPLLPYRLDAENITAWLAGSQASSYIVPDPNLGWSIRPDYKDSLYETNSQEIRISRGRLVAPQPAPGTIRILAFGDSFTHCDDVTNDQTWETWLEEGEPGLEVVNLGVPAYGTDQAFLRWRQKGPGVSGQIVILGILPENMCRNLGIIRYFLDPTGDLISKPRFVLSGDRLDLINCPVMSSAQLTEALSQPESTPILSQEFWYRPQDVINEPYYSSRIVRTLASVYEIYRRHEHRNRLYSGEDPSGIALTVAIADRFSREVEAVGSIPLILVIPMRVVLDMFPEEGSFPLVAGLRRHNLNVVEVGPAMVKEGLKDLIPYRGHLSGAGNKMLAAELRNRLRPWLDKVRAGGL